MTVAPYLDDCEPNYFPAVPAVTQANKDKRVKDSVTWDPAGPTYDEPKPRRSKSVRSSGRHPNSDFNPHSSDVNSDDDYSAPAMGGWAVTFTGRTNPTTIVGAEGELC